jgi:hypothetical protein
MGETAAISGNDLESLFSDEQLKFRKGLFRFPTGKPSVKGHQEMFLYGIKGVFLRNIDQQITLRF